jgi:hypothetical protein
MLASVGMAVVLTISPRMPPGRAERIVRARVEQDGIAVLAAATGDARWAAYLLRLAGRLVAGGDLDCQRAETGGGTTYLWVRALGSDRPINWRGDAKTG